MSKTEDKKTITKKMAELDQLVEWFYGEDFELDEAIAKYEQAMKAAEAIKADLAKLKNKVEVIGDFTKS